MSSPLKRVLVSTLCFLACACGFHPMYGDASVGNTHTALRGNIALDNVGAGHDGQLFRTALEDRFNPQGISTANAPYHLAITLQKGGSPSVIKSDGTIQRYDVSYSTEFKLFKVGKKEPVFSGSLRRVGSYNAAINANFATYEAGEDISARLLDELAEDYVMRISGLLETVKPEDLKPDPKKPLKPAEIPVGLKPAI